MPSKFNGEQLSGKQYGEWLKAGGVIKVRGEKENIKVQSVAEKGCSASMVVDDGVGEDCGAGSQSSPALVVGGGAEVKNGTVIMMEAAPLNMVKSFVTSNHKEQGEQVRWEERVPKSSNSELERATHEG